MGTFRLFKLYLRVPFLILALIEFGICVSAVFVAVYARFNGMVMESDGGIDSPLISSILFGLVMTLSMMAMGLYQSSFRGGSLGVFLRTLIGFLAGAGLLALIFYIIPSLYLGRGVLAIATVLAFFMVGTVLLAVTNAISDMANTPLRAINPTSNKMSMKFSSDAHASSITSFAGEKREVANNSSRCNNEIRDEKDRI